MRKIVFLFVVALFFTSCIFDTDNAGVSSWLSSHGMPDSYKTRVLTVDNIKADSVVVGVNTSPRLIDSLTFMIGRQSNVAYDMYMDIDFAIADTNSKPDTSFINALRASDSSFAALTFFFFDKLYKNKKFPKDSLPEKDSMNVTVSWKIDYSDRKKFLDSLSKVKDSVWMESLSDWEADGSADTVFNIEYDPSSKTNAVSLPLPSALLEDLKKIKFATRLQLKLSAPDAKHLYRFYGNESTSYPPFFGLFVNSKNGMSTSPNRAANVPVLKEECEECPILHGGARDSLVVTLPAEPILKAIEEAYEDSPLENKGEGYDVRQTVVLAQLTMARDDSKGENEFGLPIQVVVGSFVDSADTQVRRMESYRLNKEQILEDGHQNIVFHNGDSLTLQVTMGVRELVNKARDDRSLKIVVKMGYPFLQEMDTTYADYITDQKDTNFLFLNFFDYGSYDFSKAMESPMRLKLWMSSKREDD